jgi:hypothetical protein
MATVIENKKFLQGPKQLLFEARPISNVNYKGIRKSSLTYKVMAISVTNLYLIVSIKTLKFAY